MTITAKKRQKHPARYLRKDARNQIYRVLFGKQEHDRAARNPVKRSNDPWNDSERNMNFLEFDPFSAKNTLLTYMPRAELPPRIIQSLWDRYEECVSLHKRELAKVTA